MSKGHDTERAGGSAGDAGRRASRAGSAGGRPGDPAARILCVDADGAARSHVQRVLGDVPVEVVCVPSASEARERLDADWDVVLVDVQGRGSGGMELIRERSDWGEQAAVIGLCTRPTVTLAVEAMRVGAIDLLRKPIDADELLERLEAALDRAAATKRSERRVARLKRICKRLQTERESVAEQAGVLCEDLATAYEELADQVAAASVTSEFASLIRGELDVEELLRTLLEYVLTKTGPTNAAVFLPTGHEDYSLGAYVNYDLPRDTADVLLDHLADVLPEEFEGEETVAVLAGSSAVRGRLGDEAEWLDGSCLAVLACVHRGETLAVMSLFRDVAAPFSEDVLQTLRVLRDLFAEQLGRVITIHNRHKQTEGLPGFTIEGPDHEETDEEDDYFGGSGDWGMAA